MCIWHGPSGDIIKINVDGAINGQDMVAGSGGVARDSSRRFKGAWCKSYPRTVDPLTSEVLALCDAMVFARGHSFSCILVETDCSELVRLWEKRDQSLLDCSSS
jgi:ribonuclease HI